MPARRRTIAVSAATAPSMPLAIASARKLLVLLLPVAGSNTISVSGATVVVGCNVVSTATVVVVGATVVVVVVGAAVVVVGAIVVVVVVGATVVVVVVVGTSCHIAYKWSVSPSPGITYASEGE